MDVLNIAPPWPRIDGSLSPKRHRSKADAIGASTNAKKSQINSTNSPLLTLPAEIRNRIYELAFGGHNIHINLANSSGPIVDPTENRLVRCVCSADESDHSAATAVRKAKDYNYDYRKVYTLRHNYCWVELGQPSFGGMLNVLGTCKQIFNEAALLPYELNTFTFEDARAMMLFLKLLAKPSMEAIEHLTLFAHNNSAEVGGVISYMHLISQLTGLKHFMLIAQDDMPWQDIVDFQARNPDISERLGIFPTARAFAQLKLETVIAMIYPQIPKTPVIEHEDMEYLLKQFRKWAMELEDVILHSLPLVVKSNVDEGEVEKVPERLMVDNGY